MLYLGDCKIKVNLDGIAYYMNLGVKQSSIKDILLASLDNYILQDSNGMYLTVKEVN